MNDILPAFVEGYVYKDNLVGGYPISQLLSENTTGGGGPTMALQHYVVPVGLVCQPARPSSVWMVHQEEATREPIGDELFERLFEKIALNTVAAAPTLAAQKPPVADMTLAAQKPQVDSQETEIVIPLPPKKPASSKKKREKNPPKKISLKIHKKK
jgi:hypothetical protein